MLSAVLIDKVMEIQSSAWFGPVGKTMNTIDCFAEGYRAEAIYHNGGRI